MNFPLGYLEALSSYHITISRLFPYSGKLLFHYRLLENGIKMRKYVL